MLEDSEILSIFGDLLRAPAHEIGPAIERALARASAQVGSARCWLFCISTPENQTTLQASHGDGAAMAMSGDCRTLVLPWIDELEACRPVSLPDTAALPTDLEARAQLLAAGIAQCTLLPVMQEGRLRGVLLVEAADLSGRCTSGVLQLMALTLMLLERSARETQQTEAIHRLTAILDAMPELMFEVDADACYTGFYAGPPHLMARPPEEMKGKTLAEVLPEPVQAIATKALHTVLEQGRVQNVIYSMKLPTGDFTFELSGSRKDATTPEGKPSAIFIVRDISRRRALQSEMLRLRRVVQSMGNLAIFTDIEGRVQWVNAAFERRSGWSNEEIRGRDFKSLVRCDDSDQGAADGLETALEEQRAFTGQTINQDRYGNRYWIDFNVLPLTGENGQVEGWVSIETDVTHIKMQEAATEAMARRAEASYRQLESALNALPDAAVVFDGDEQLVLCNPAFRKQFPELAKGIEPGITLRELFRRGASEGFFNSPKDDSELEEWLDEQLAAYRQPYYADEVQLRDGRWLRRVHSRTSDGSLIGIGIDVTARRRQIEALDSMNQELVSVLKERDEARRRLVSIMNGAQVGTWELDVRKGQMTTGGHWAQILGRGDELPRSFPLATLIDLIHPDDRDVFEQRNVYLPGFGSGVFEFEMRLLHKKGHWVWVMSRGQVLQRDVDGNPEHMVGVHLDISERKRLEREVDASQAQLRSAMESSVAAISLYDENGILIYCNTEARRILNLEPGMRNGNRDGEAPWRLEHVDGRRLASHEYPFELVGKAGGPVRDVKYAVRWPDGTRRVLTGNVSPVDGGDGHRNVVISFWDITEQIAVTETLEKALLHAEEMSRAKSTFLANMSHEIRTPLNGVLGLAEVLDMQITDPGQRKMIASIRQSGATLLAVLNSILDMSKIEAGKMELEHAPIVLGEIISQLAATYAVQAEEKGLEFEVFSSSGCDVPRMGDGHRIRQILHNLLSNAMKFTEQGEVRLNVSCRVGKPVVVRVSDTGVGMTEEQAARAFDSFEQAEVGTTRRFGGTGLGLSIVRELAQKMGGSVSIESAQGRGTSVSVTLPLAMVDGSAPVIAPTKAVPEAAPARSLAAPQPAPAERVVPPSTGSSLHVLGVDDNATNREVLSGMLSQLGVSLDLAEDGRRALDKWEEAHAAGQHYDVILLDLTMPVMDGRTALELIRQIEKARGLRRTRVVAVTGEIFASDGAELLKLDFDGYLLKPYSLRDLQKTLGVAAKLPLGKE
ncbi:PAS domain S-box protein [Gemmobacter serpentinus]|uniref:PAS domain S-box protein n=1 Tax=Gemmobacter serpentinus TaxID=2652247 RepID=UPI00186583A3|nr:PAS domain S-box protein [Gemmobacter serpentinus]